MSFPVGCSQITVVSMFTQTFIHLTTCKRLIPIDVQVSPGNGTLNTNVLQIPIYLSVKLVYVWRLYICQVGSRDPAAFGFLQKTSMLFPVQMLKLHNFLLSLIALGKIMFLGILSLPMLYHSVWGGMGLHYMALVGRLVALL